MFAGRMSTRQMKVMMRRAGISTEELSNVQEVVIRTTDKQYVFKEPEVVIVTVPGQKIYQIIGEPKVIGAGEVAPKPEHELEIPEEDIKLVAEHANVSEEEARKALEECGGEPAEAIIKLSSKK